MFSLSQLLVIGGGKISPMLTISMFFIVALAFYLLRVLFIRIRFCHDRPIGWRIFLALAVALTLVLFISLGAMMSEVTGIPLVLQRFL